MKIIFGFLVCISVFSMVELQKTPGNKARKVRLLGSNKIVGGVQVTIANYPYQLSLRENNDHLCGASIISTSWAITAAHCVENSAENTLTIRSGSASRISGGTLHPVTKKVVHPQFDATTFDYDMALLKVSKLFTYGPSVKNIALPVTTTKIPTGVPANASGWGATSATYDVLPTMLYAVTVPIVSESSCQNSYTVDDITPRMICAGVPEGGKDTCGGDSGGPLVAVVDKVKMLVGITSWGSSCAEPDSPGVYTNVANLRSWIKSTSGV